MKKLWVRLLALMAFVVVCIAGACANEKHDYSKEFGVESSGCGCSSPTFNEPRGTKTELSKRFVEGKVVLDVDKDEQDFVKGFTYSISVKGFSSEMVYNSCVVEVTIYYSQINYQGDVVIEKDSLQVSLSAKGSGKADKYVKIACYDIKVQSMSLEYSGTVTYL